jgi:hypothetical protein
MDKMMVRYKGKFPIEAIVTQQTHQMGIEGNVTKHDVNDITCTLLIISILHVLVLVSITWMNDIIMQYHEEAI